MLTAARNQSGANFREGSALPPTDPAIPTAIQHTDANINFLPGGLYEPAPPPHRR